MKKQESGDVPMVTVVDKVPKQPFLDEVPSPVPGKVPNVKKQQLLGVVQPVESVDTIVPVHIEVPSLLTGKVPLNMEQQQFVEVPQVEVVNAIVLDPEKLQIQVNTLRHGLKAYLGAGGNDEALIELFCRQIADLLGALNDL